MTGYALYTMLAIGLVVLLTAVFRWLRQDDERIASPEEDAAFHHKIEEIEAQYGRTRAPRPGDPG